MPGKPVAYIAHDQIVRDHKTKELGPRDFGWAEDGDKRDLARVFEDKDISLDDDERAQKAKKLLENFTEDDYLILTGHPLLMLQCAAECLSKIRVPLKVLYWVAPLGRGFEGRLKL